MTRILGLGDNTIDTYVDAGVQYPGGNAVNVAVMTSRLGADTAYLGCVGADEGGALVRAALAAEGVDHSRLRIRSGANARAFVDHVDGDRQFLSSHPGVRADYCWEEADFAYMATFDHVHTSIYSELDDALPRISGTTRSLSFDVSNRWTADYLQQILPHVRFIFLSASELSEGEAVKLAAGCLDGGLEAVVLTRGGDGALAVSASGTVRQPALPATVVDTMGAGDAFISGFLVSVLSGFALPEAMARGAAFAAEACGWQGGFGHGQPWNGDRQAAQATASQ